MHVNLDPAHVLLNRRERRALNPKPGAVFVAVPPGADVAHGERFKVAGMRRDGDAWVKCQPGQETELTAVVCRSPK